jgi:hypothetical protein
MVAPLSLLCEHGYRCQALCHICWRAGTGQSGKVSKTINSYVAHTVTPFGTIIVSGCGLSFLG